MNENDIPDRDELNFMEDATIIMVNIRLASQAFRQASKAMEQFLDSCKDGGLDKNRPCPEGGE